MADLGGGVFVSRVDSDEFDADDEIGGFTHTLFEDGETMAGIWKPGSDVDSWPKTERLHARETIVVLEGSQRRIGAGGSTVLHVRYTRLR